MKTLASVIVLLLLVSTAEAQTYLIAWTAATDVTKYELCLNDICVDKGTATSGTLTVPGDGTYTLKIRTWNGTKFEDGDPYTLTVNSTNPVPPPTGEMTHKGRWKDGGQARALPNYIHMPGHFSTWGPKVCAESARKLGYGPGDFIGMQALQQCWAGKNGIDNPYRYGQPVPLGVSKTCRDGSGELCGGDWVNDIFELH